MIFRKATAGVGVRGMDAGGQISDGGVAGSGRSGVEVAEGGGQIEGVSAGQSSVMGVANKNEGPMRGQSPGVGVTEAKESDISMGIQGSGVGVAEDDPYGASTDEEGTEEMEVPVEVQSSGVGVAEVEDPYGVSTDEEGTSDDGEGNRA